ncbi:MAG: 30S ribosomal protein S9 [Thermoleophilaceae bacterium]
MTIEDERQEPREEGAPEGAGQDAPGAPEGEAPAAPEGEAPGAQSDAPAEAEGETPEGEGEVPAPEGETPEGEGEVPAAEGETPEGEVEGPAPRSGDQAPGPDEPAPAEPEAGGAPDAGEQPPPDDPAAEPKRPPRGRERRGDAAGVAEQPEVVPGADLEPDLVLDEPARQDDQFETAAAERYAEPEAEATADEALPTAPEESPAAAAEPAPLTPRDLAADARYQATGKRKTAVARVILKPGDGTYTVNGRTLEQFFPRHGLQATARQPLAAAGYESRMDVVARLHGGGVSSQAGALRHGVARALVEADPALREELKRRGYLTRDPRAKERKKAGLKKARKRPQFSKR